MGLRIILVFAFVVTGFSSPAQCVLKKDQDSIRVYACSNEALPFKSIMASFTLQASTAEMVSVLMDAGNYTQWQFNTIQAKVLERKSDRDFMYYIEVDAPWPISNRDLVVHFTMEEDSVTKTTKVTANSIPDFIPAVDGLVRVPSSASQWKITPVGSGKLSIEYSIQIDPGGAVPSWMANMVTANAPWESFRNLRERISVLRRTK